MAEELTKGKDEIYCPECGRTIPRGLQGCPLCYADFRKIFALDEGWNKLSSGTSAYQDRYQPASTPSSRVPVKSKAVAVILAVFLGYWAWLYTYGKNRLKFWSAMGAFAALFVINFAYSCSFIGDAVSGYPYPDDFFPGGFIVFMVISYIVYFGVWIWTLVDNAMKPESFYRDYPYG